MPHFVMRSASQTNPVPSPTSTWHVGIAPAFPSSLTLTSDAALESLLMDIPFLSVGLLGFGVLTFFFAMRKLNRLAFYVFAAVIIAFIAGILDVGQVLIRGRTSTLPDAGVSSVLPLLVARELALAISIGIRFFFFWSFVSKPPRGECPFIRTSQEPSNFLRMGSDVHSGSWTRWGSAGVIFQFTLLFATITIPVLQLIWRFSEQFDSFGPVYNADGTLEIVLSALFIIKLLTNAWISPLTPRWKTIRDYSPVIIALLLGHAVGIGNILCFQFSESSLGRFLQALQLYILVLYILISSFYQQRRHVSVVENPPDRRGMVTTPFQGIQPGERVSSFRLTLPSVSTPDNVGADFASRIESPNSRPSKRMSSWLVPDASNIPERPGGPRRASTTEKLASWLAPKRGPGRQDREQSRLWIKEDVEARNSSVEEKTGIVASPHASPIEPPEAGTWKDPVYASVAPLTGAGQRLERITTALDAPPSIARTGAVSPDGTISSFNVDNYKDFLPPRTRNQLRPGSPVYGLNGIVRYHDESPQPRPDSVQSAGMESLLRQQAELDKSVAELQLFSPISRSSATSGKPIVPGGQPESFRSEFTLSNFPEPPVDPPSMLAGEQIARSSAGELDVMEGALGRGFVQDELPVIPRRPPIPAATVESRKQQSFTRRSGGLAVVGTETSRRAFLGSGGTQYDVTSFIGGLTTPGLTEPSPSFKNQPRRPVPRAIEQPNSEGMTAVQGKGNVEPPSAPVQIQSPPATFMPAGEGNLSTRLSGPRLVKVGLSSRSRLNISSPIPPANAERSTAYERPRRVPVP